MALAQGAIRSIANAAFPKLFAKGYSANAALGALKTLGFGYQRKLFLKDWRTYTGAKKLERVYRFIPRKIRLSYNLMAPTEFYQRKKYKYVMETQAKDIVTGEIRPMTQSMESDTRYSIDEATSKWLAKIMDEEKRYSWEGTMIPVSTELMVVYRKLPIRATFGEPEWIETEPLGPEWVS